jgi:hypothetical protein
MIISSLNGIELVKYRQLFSLYSLNIYRTPTENMYQTYFLFLIESIGPILICTRDIQMFIR